jgi:lysophospholipase L1-like esterase
MLSGCGGGSSGSGSGSGAGSSRNPNLQNKIVVVSDSVGLGIGSAVSFAELLENRTGIPVVNVSVPGASAEEGVGRIPGLINTESPRYLVVLLGLNNAAGAAGGPAGAISSLQIAADLANGSGVIAIIGTLPPVIRTPSESSNADFISQGIRGISGARIADNRAVMNGSHIGPDGFHPNTAGHDVMANVFADQIF